MAGGSISVEEVDLLERGEIIEHLDRLDVKWNSTDNTDYLRKKLKKAISESEAIASEPKAIDPMQVLSAFMSTFERQSETLNQILGSMQSQGGAGATNTGGGGSSTSHHRQNHDESKTVPHQPNKLNENVTYREFKLWETSWKYYAKATEFAKRSREKQIGTFFTYFNTELLNKLHYSAGISEDTTDDIATIIANIKEYLKGKENIAVHRFRLLNRCQEPKESFEDFNCAIGEIADDADIAEMGPEEWKATLIIGGIRDEEVRKELLAKRPAPTLEETIDLCKTREAAEKDKSKCRARASAETVSVNANVTKRSRSKSRGRNKGRSPTRPSNKCWNCGENWPHDDAKPCRAIGKTCFKCNRPGHLGSVCRNPKANANPSGNANAKSTKKTTGAIRIADVHREAEGQPVVMVEYYDSDGHFVDKKFSIADTGAQVCVAGQGLLKKWGKKKKLKAATENIQSVNGRPLDCLGTIDMTMKVAENENEHVEKVYICRDIGN